MQRIYTVSRLNRQARQVLESEIGQVWIRGEISNFVAARSGHWYFTIKDEYAQVRAAMFKNANRLTGQRPKEGDRILARANLSLYEPRGDYQVIVEHLEPEGEGLLKQQFEQLKAKLQAQGLFDQARKRPLPDAIRRVGVVTSATGAAIKDILTVLHRRNPAIEVVIYPTQVQGENAHQQIIQAIQTANRRTEVDVLIVGRGGGSLEDLWCFNHEQLALAIVQSSLPVVSAVGHEVDVSIADLVADLRAPTPSAAAELVSQDSSELLRQLHQQYQRLVRGMAQRVQTARHQFQLARHHLRQLHPEIQLQQQSQRMDQLQVRLQRQMQATLTGQRHRYQIARQQLSHLSPDKRIEQTKERLKQYHLQLLRSTQQQLRAGKERLAHNAHLLDTVSPLATLARGYSISFQQDKVLRSVDEVDVGHSLTTKLKDGEIVSTVKSVGTSSQ
ncbi:Exodeoxyribonuclease VII [Saliniradius amylolyticus]|uniref:Exodeoxyribonuclease 7 large subunit n=1 Tax=Saliniradius amylolyticus TaxID=2183582 RepID=A0A2S2E4X1_9ALTE|nr:exodeoxyribonuclease VII large subunit [Saliniradius amylolyticus]AWL12695.1 Exodeoxyribonuclease VII [Saliniradius amylolyticus]